MSLYLPFPVDLRRFLTQWWTRLYDRIPLKLKKKTRLPSRPPSDWSIQEWQSILKEQWGVDLLKAGFPLINSVVPRKMSFSVFMGIYLEWMPVGVHPRYLEYVLLAEQPSVPLTVYVSDLVSHVVKKPHTTVFLDTRWIDLHSLNEWLSRVPEKQGMPLDVYSKDWRYYSLAAYQSRYGTAYVICLLQNLLADSLCGRPLPLLPSLVWKERFGAGSEFKTEVFNYIIAYPKKSNIRDCLQKSRVSSV
jgi:hypothetical protein